MSQTNPTVIFCTTTNRIIDFVHTRIAETPEDALARLSGEYGTALQPMPYDQAAKLYEDSFKTPVEEITPEDYDYALNCLPPVAWVNARGADSFKMSERMAGNITAIFVAMQNRYFRFYDHIRTPHEDCCQRVADFIRTNAQATEVEGRAEAR